MDEMEIQTELSDSNQVPLLKDTEQESGNSNGASNDVQDQDLAESNSSDTSQQLSKRMQRKIRKREQWLANLPAKRAKEREKYKLKRQAARANNEVLPSRKKLKECTMANSSCKVRDIGKCVKQMMRCYTLNRRTENPMQLYFTSFNGKSEQEMNKNNGYMNWDVHFEKNAYTDVFSKDEIIYLSSESDNIISDLDDTKVYIIGGLVDHNAHKGLCHRLAEEKKIAHAQLPISEFLDLKSRKVLTIDHVFEILLGVSQGLSWKDAFLKVLPQRKGAIVKEENSSDTCTDVKNSENACINTENTFTHKELSALSEVNKIEVEEKLSET
ncbi:tRNA methyltransferase 10 homolog A isoform X2 [Thrips palmi]|uniref:tRNA (guanine(9)-N(1))-methyltransferase n=1 Tax=Thrips palmi TaxID=161013 RepID=A0A6P8ZDK6_THRPL|nr:tRNA methyltransferase 10 homolog A isoform X2 [Thrips palmi]